MTYLIIISLTLVILRIVGWINITDKAKKDIKNFINWIKEKWGGTTP